MRLNGRMHERRRSTATHSEHTWFVIYTTIFCGTNFHIFQTEKRYVQKCRQRRSEPGHTHTRISWLRQTTKMMKSNGWAPDKNKQNTLKIWTKNKSSKLRCIFGYTPSIIYFMNQLHFLESCERRDKHFMLVCITYPCWLLVLHVPKTFILSKFFMFSRILTYSCEKMR